MKRSRTRPARRHTVRATFDRRFTARRMADDYLDLYRALAGGAQRVLRSMRRTKAGGRPRLYQGRLIPDHG